ncbi:MAG: type I methionyl aminopeptidase [Bacteroidales bacterium]|nr:type I methionyl aminopeptidase [Bacteroidales bacterium]
MIYYKSEEEIELIKISSLLVGKTLAEVAKIIKPGIKTIFLDTIAEEFIRDNNAIPAFKNYRSYPNTLCISVNAEVVHGIPGDREIKDGDIVSVDCGVMKSGYFGDSAFTFAVGVADEKVVGLLRATKKALYLGIEKARIGNRIGDISAEIQSYCESNGYSVVRELVGHGVGKKLHEEPEVPNYGKRGRGIKIHEGLVIAIEPMINMGRKEVIRLQDGWTITTADGMPSAHFEHTIAVKKDKTEILSCFEEIEKTDNVYLTKI